MQLEIQTEEAKFSIRHDGSQILLSGWDEAASGETYFSHREAWVFASRLRQVAQQEEFDFLNNKGAAVMKIAPDGRVMLGLLISPVWEDGGQIFLLHFTGPRGGQLPPLTVRSPASLMHLADAIEEAATLVDC